MNTEILFSYLNSFNGVEESSPFGIRSNVYKVGGKMFCTFGHLYEPPHLTLKVSPDQIPSLIDQYEFIIPGYYMNKKHWITIEFREDIRVDLEFVKAMINESYMLVFSKLSKKIRNEI
ncbi:MmcQ/YjbR family DNA-binding protein [Vibrio crassostreae]|nr:MmcQ/YjbR family DNA-binding protein [Vibrio crassostreae]CAK2803346.1 MmcQ/YjbR family DNA-binding protein [Vibrio crassostreae]CAK3292804.1 MmcQ/YjbR family DNA-binding protein [Vibrio crassostreae]CAK3846610.1 MmcQ/YjbR family DNA-binding protein [Vibrio crassostreae]